MKTAVKDTSIETYYARIVAPGVELTQIDRIVAYVIAHPCCTRRQVAAYFRSIDPACALAQEARVSARVNAAIKRGVLDESAAPVVDAETHERAYPLYPHNYQPQRDLFFARQMLHGSGNHLEA
ncbi:MAG TPA: hypothetical protein VNE18_10320 [Rhodanobacter sp.]|nr:hypothetical protein [Rhodanobacter sp.]